MGREKGLKTCARCARDVPATSEQDSFRSKVHYAFSAAELPEAQTRGVRSTGFFIGNRKGGH